MKVGFLHPRHSGTFEAEVEPHTTGGACIQGLIDAKFIDEAPTGRPYALVASRSQKQLLPATSMQEAGVQPGDHLAVVQMEHGAA